LDVPCGSAFEKHEQQPLVLAFSDANGQPLYRLAGANLGKITLMSPG